MVPLGMTVATPSSTIKACLLHTRLTTRPTTTHFYFKFRLNPRSLSITKMALPLHSTTKIISSNSNHQRKLPILLFDIMDTLVRDPFYQDIPAFFGMSLKELIDCKHPTAWVEFEKGLIDEMELTRKFFKDGREFDLEGLKTCMTNGYSYIEGMEQMLLSLKQNNYEMHAFTNYPIWYQMIEDKLKLSNYLSWTFCSCAHGKRKPDTEFYVEVLRHLNVDPANCIFVDDRPKNVEAANEVGIKGLHFKSVNLLREELSSLGIDITADVDR